MLTCPKCGCSVIRVIDTKTIIHNGKQVEADILQCTNCGHKDIETNE
jgi:C4-type Zn-finger protein